MAKPMTADQFVKALRAEGLHVVEHPGWRTNNRNHKGAWGPVNGVVIHHTAGRNSKSLVFNGTSTLPGPLCHSHLAKDGTVTMIGNGRANHAGTFALNAFNAMLNEWSNHPYPDRAEPIDANARTYGIEVENLGDGEDYYPHVQYDAAVRWAAAICRFHGWTADSVIGHKEGTRRKIDPRGPVGSSNGPQWDMDQFRRDVQKRLDGKASDGGKVEAPKESAGSGSDGSKPASSSTPARYRVTINGLEYGYGAKGDHVTKVGKALVKRGFGRHYKVGPGPTWSDADTRAYAAWQRSLGYTGKDADGVPGETSLKKLLGSLPGKRASKPKKVPPFPGRHYFRPGATNTYVTQLGKALVKRGYGRFYKVGPGPRWTDADRQAVRAFQLDQGWRGSDADGYPGPETWRRLMS
ncbi:peptidoglycan-binding protein [Streptomyces sp. URMC 125]|uniref:peptidoglycan-binding protein n=1 Tax=Streptomyces sp. URMC 125 TaxID=3423419 RepID=UPI003F1D616A